MLSVALLPVELNGPRPDLLVCVLRIGAFVAWSAPERALLEAARRTLTARARRRNQQQHLERETKTNALTALGNRRALNTDLAARLLEARRSGAPVGVLSIDVDGLKAINDQEGHARGDELLRFFGEALHTGFRAGDRAYRLGGDEYVLVLPGAGPQDIEKILERVQEAVTRTRQTGFAAMGASAGLACFPVDGEDAAQLLRLSDARMYAQKSSKLDQGMDDEGRQGDS